MFATTVGPAAFHSMLPPILRIVTEDYEPAKEVGQLCGYGRLRWLVGNRDKTSEDKERD